MENEELDQQELSQETQPRAPRPRRQIWLARVCLVLFVAMILMYMINIARGGL